MDIFQSIFLGAVQGITEFLPISSSGHLILFPYIFNWDYSGLAFDVSLHLGTTIAIIFFFWKDWVNIMGRAFKKKTVLNDPAEDNYPNNFLWQIVVASIPAAIFGFLFEDLIENVFHSSVILVAINLILFGIVLFAVDKFTKTDQKTEKISYLQSLLVGFSQALALIPGVSRSGITMIASRSLGLDREKAARFSFLLSTPATLGAFVFSMRDLSMSEVNSAFILGVVASMIFGFFAIKFLLEYLKKGSFALFMWYRIILAIVIFALYFSR